MVAEAGDALVRPHGHGRVRGEPAWVALLRALVRTPDRLLHARRRRAAMAALAARPRPRVALFVCRGNLCRSPFAAGAFAREPGAAGIAVDSAGLLWSGLPAPPEAIRAAARRGVDLRTHRSQLVTPALVEGADLLVAMDGAQRRALLARFGRRPGGVILLGDLDPEPIASRTVRDPAGRPEALFEEVYARIVRCVAALASALRR